MKRRRVIVLCVIVTLLAVVAIFALPRREPAYQGKTLSQWMREANLGVWPRESPVAADSAIGQIGTNGFPVVSELLRSHDSAIKSRFLALYYKQSLFRFPVTTQNDCHARALAACWALGAEAKPLVPEVGNALTRMDPYLRPAFENWLQSLGPDADAAVPALLVVLQDRNDPTRQTAAQTLGKISNQHTPQVLPVLRACSDDTNAMVRFWAA
ncbi:MAG TPA: HEAT repeat domain-containing protein, partial [Candidatus Dormibacteraeota bacterium]|nr:HEAT repeat domain-containing protein [Candidatus Dormibacteraeota bacterium]